MSTNVLERSRVLHQDIEEFENKLVKLLSETKKSKKDQVIQEYTAKKYIDRIVESERQLADIYEDKDKLRKEELDKITTQTVFTNFYDKLRALKDAHKTSVQPMNIVTNNETDISYITKLFTGEENYGKNLDMHDLHDKYLNLKFFKHRRCNYPKFLQSLSELTNLTRKQKTFEYKQFIEDIVSYLEGFYSRIHPLYDKKKILNPIIKEAFENDWEKGFISGWKDKGEEKEIEEKENTSSDSKTKKRKKKKRPESLKKELAFLEYKLCKYAEILDEDIINTIQFLEKKATRRWDEEIHDDDENEDHEIESDEEEEDELIYNPKKLPKGWDDKPIPYWLYRLHGLNLEFKCEICGNYSYWGPKIFQKHFQEWRHSEGMKCLGIPNLKHFQNITIIEDAIMLWEKIKTQNIGKKFEPALEEEFEDANGNLITRATKVPNTTEQSGDVTGFIPPQQN